MSLNKYNVKINYYLKIADSLELIDEIEKYITAEDKADLIAEIKYDAYENEEGVFKKFLYKNGYSLYLSKKDFKISYKILSVEELAVSVPQTTVNEYPQVYIRETIDTQNKSSILDLPERISYYLNSYKAKYEYKLRFIAKYFRTDKSYNTYLAETEDRIITLLTDVEFNKDSFICNKLPGKVKELIWKKYGTRIELDIQVIEKTILPEKQNPTYDNSYSYSSHCWRCKRPLSSLTNKKCNVCGWYICECGACREGGCVGKKDQGYTSTSFFDDIFDFFGF